MLKPVQLRNVIDSDLPIFFEQQNAPEANHMANFPARDEAAFMAHWAKVRRDETNLLRTIVADDQVVGNIVCFEMNGQREVGYWLGRAYWGQGFATQALAAFLPEIEQRPLYGYVAKHNRASIRVLEKCGFVICGEEAEDIILKLEA
ncbi:MAG: GNAT family N-acetyltransferase [Chloroflexi bacterium]|nr:GNAT family N-acetyltransferase [Chloroflexota bacterium]